jgi:phosphoglycerate dehydrogenase-like enzyme
MTSVAVTSRSFSKHPLLRKTLCEKYSKVSFNEDGKSLTGQDLIHFLQGHEMAIIGLERINEDILNQLPELKVISRFGVGIDTLDLNALKNKNIRLSVTAGANKRAVSELVIAFAINMLRQLPLANHELRAGLWKQTKGRQLSETHFGIIGLGAIGKDLVSLLKPFQCKIYAFDLIPQAKFCAEHHIEQVDLKSLLAHSDVVSLHLPFNQATQLILDDAHLALMKANAILINTARGGLVAENTLKRMLQHHQLGGAAFDVFSIEPPLDQELLTLPNFFATPHIGGSTEEAIVAMGQAAILGLETAEIWT